MDGDGAARAVLGFLVYRLSSIRTSTRIPERAQLTESQLSVGSARPDQGLFRKPVYAMPWSLHPVEDSASERGVGILKAEGKITEDAFAPIRDGLDMYLGGAWG